VRYLFPDRESLDLDLQCYDSTEKHVFYESRKKTILSKNNPFSIQQWFDLTDISDLAFCYAKISYINRWSDRWITEEFRIDGFKTAEITSTVWKSDWDPDINDYHSKIKDFKVKTEQKCFSEAFDPKSMMLSLEYTYDFYFTLPDLLVYAAVLTSSDVSKALAFSAHFLTPLIIQPATETVNFGLPLVFAEKVIYPYENFYASLPLSIDDADSNNAREIDYDSCYYRSYIHFFRTFKLHKCMDQDIILP